MPTESQPNADTAGTDQDGELEDILFDLADHTSWTNLTRLPFQDLLMFLRLWVFVPVIGVPALAIATIFLGDHLASAIRLCQAHCGSLIPPQWGNPWPTILDVTQGLVLSLGLAGLIWLFIWAFTPMKETLRRYERRCLRKTKALMDKRSTLPWDLHILVRVRRDHEPATTHHGSYTDWYVGFSAIEETVPNEPLFAFELAPNDIMDGDRFPGIELLVEAGQRSNNKNISFWVACADQDKALGLTRAHLSDSIDFELPSACREHKSFELYAGEALRVAAIVCGYPLAEDAEEPTA